MLTITAEQVLDLELPEGSNARGQAPARTTIRGYLTALLSALWTDVDESSGKRPLGDSGWDSDLVAVLVHHGVVGSQLHITEQDDVSDADMRDGRLVIGAAIAAMCCGRHEPLLQTFYVTFGVGYAREQHPVLPFSQAHPDGYMRVDAPDELIARRVLARWLGGAYSMIYSAGEGGVPPFAGGDGRVNHFPRGQTSHVQITAGQDGSDTTVALLP